MFTKEELNYLEKEIDLTVECASRMLIKEDNDEIKREIKIAESILEKLRKM